MSADSARVHFQFKKAFLALGVLNHSKSHDIVNKIMLIPIQKVQFLPARCCCNTFRVVTNGIHNFYPPEWNNQLIALFQCNNHQGAHWNINVPMGKRIER